MSKYAKQWIVFLKERGFTNLEVAATLKHEGAVVQVTTQIMRQCHKCYVENACYIDLSGIHTPTLCVWAAPLTKVLHYGTPNAVLRSKYITEWCSISTRDCYISHWEQLSWQLQLMVACDILLLFRYLALVQLPMDYGNTKNVAQWAHQENLLQIIRWTT